ncbi:MAG: EAL domain-containing protein [Gammaproteobacteria bacterium]|nr:EAL domain-containing protein [Gammaproteobacteria bacterium]
MTQPASPTVLLIEESATLRYALEKQLRVNQYQVLVADTYSRGQELLLEPAQRIDLVVVGWPAHTHPAADELFTLLEEPRPGTLPVLVLVQDPDAATRTWAIRRSHTAMLDWRHHAELPATLRKLFSSLDSHESHHPCAPVQRAQVKVLFVDDSPSVRAHYRRLLTSKGYVADIASNITEAFDKAKRNAYDIAIIDYFMPDGNGDELCRKLRDEPNTRHIATAIFTSTYLDQVIRDSLNAGAVECMFKNEVDDLFLARVDAMSRSVEGTKSIEAERRRLQSILNSVGDGVYGVDRDGRITFANPATRIALGYDDETALIGRAAHDVMHYADESGTRIAPTASLLNCAYGSRQVVRAWETVFWSRDGQCIPVECTIYPLYVRGQHEGSVVAFRDIAERKSLEERLRWQAMHDPLTELFNRRYFEEQLEREQQWQVRYRGTSALLYLDLDHFKYINDTAGHTAGDALLVDIGHRLQERLRKTDTLARLGGDEFAVIMRNIDAQDIAPAADAFRRAITERDFYYQDKTFKMAASIGVALFDHTAASPGDILVDADIGCHIAKSQGGNRTHIYSDESDHKTKMDADLGWSTQLRDALASDRFELHYQPILPLSMYRDKLADIDTDTRLWNSLDPNNLPCKIGFEVLLRLRDKNGDLVPPNIFIPTAERFFLMPEIDLWVLNRATAELAKLRREFGPACFSINLSGHTLCHPDLIPRIRAAIERHSLDPVSLTFEVTETAAICDMRAAQRAIHALKELGCHFSLDDFGTGFSSFSHLKQLPVDFIKIDGMFIQSIANDPIDRALVRSIADIAHHLGCRTIAEYVDSPEIMQVLIECGVDFIQGNIIAEPLASPIPPRFVATLAS